MMNFKILQHHKIHPNNLKLLSLPFPATHKKKKKVFGYYMSNDLVSTCF